MGLPIELQADEHVVAIWRRTPVFLWGRLVVSAFAALVPVILVLWIVWATAGLGGVLGTVVLVVCAVWIAGWLVSGYLAWYRHRHDEWILTDQRLIDSYKPHWFSHRLASADLVNVQDISVNRHGLLRSLFNFGDVVCQTAGTESRFVIASVPRPAQVLSVVDRVRDAARSAALPSGPRSSPTGYEAPMAPERPHQPAPPDHIGGRPPPPPSEGGRS